MAEKACYRDLRRYKYQLTEDYSVDSGIKVKEKIDTPFIILEPDGNLTIKKKYAWDGPSGPTIDTKTFMRGSLVHDAFYQLMRESRLPLNDRDKSDRLLQKICKEDGMFFFRAWYTYLGLKWFGKKHAAPQKPKPEIIVCVGQK